MDHILIGPILYLRGKINQLIIRLVGKPFKNNIRIIRWYKVARGINIILRYIFWKIKSSLSHTYVYTLVYQGKCDWGKKVQSLPLI